MCAVDGCFWYFRGKFYGLFYELNVTRKVRFSQKGDPPRFSVISRICAQLGAPVHDFWPYIEAKIFGHPDMMLVPAFGTRCLGANNLTIFHFLGGFTKPIEEGPHLIS